MEGALAMSPKSETGKQPDLGGEAPETKRLAMSDLDVSLEPSAFFSDFSVTLAEALEDTLGVTNAEGLIGMAGDQMGHCISAEYGEAMGDQAVCDEAVLGQILTDIKRRLHGNFTVESCDATDLVLTNSCCPFAQGAKGRPSLCMMTAHVFGRVVADRTGYAKVDIEESIARGHGGCRVRVRLVDDRGGTGREFFKS